MSFFLLMIPHVHCVLDADASLVDCVGDYESFSTIYGDCPSYSDLYQNHAWCNSDADSAGILARQACPECGACAIPINQALDCKVSEWTEFSQCTARCGPQTSTRTRSIIQKAANGGKVCPILSETKECDLPPCPTVVAENCKATPFFHTGDTNEGKLVGDCQLGELIHIDAENFGDLIHFCRSECFDNPDCGYFQVTRHTDNCVLFDKLTTCDKLVPTKDVFVYELDCPPPVVEGCTNPAAYNYNVAADRDDGSCVQVVKGCTDPKSPNYDENANTDDGSCQKPGRRILNEEGVQVPRLILQEEESLKKEITAQ